MLPNAVLIRIWVMMSQFRSVSDAKLEVVRVRLESEKDFYFEKVSKIIFFYDKGPLSILFIVNYDSCERQRDRQTQTERERERERER